MPAKKMIKEESSGANAVEGEEKTQGKETSEKVGKKSKTSGRTIRKEKGKVERKKESRKRKSGISTKDGKGEHEGNQSENLFGSSEGNSKKGEASQNMEEVQNAEEAPKKSEDREKPGNSGGITVSYGYEIHGNTELFSRKTEEDKEMGEKEPKRKDADKIEELGEGEEKKEDAEATPIEEKKEETKTEDKSQKLEGDTSLKISENSEGRQETEAKQDEGRKHEIREKTTDEEEVSPPPPPNALPLSQNQAKPT